MRVKQQYEKAYNIVVLSDGIGYARDVYKKAPMCCLAARSSDASSAPVIFRPKDFDCRPGEQAHRTHVITAVADYQAQYTTLTKLRKGVTTISGNHRRRVRRLNDR